MQNETRDTAAAPPALTPRERYVLESLAAGQSGGETARALGMSHRTVKRIVANLEQRFAASNLFTLGLRAAPFLSDGHVPPDDRPVGAARTVRRRRPAPTRRLTTAQVEEVRRRYAAANGRRGLITQLAREYGLSKTAMRMLLTGRTYRPHSRGPDAGAAPRVTG